MNSINDAVQGRGVIRKVAAARWIPRARRIGIVRWVLNSALLLAGTAVAAQSTPDTRPSANPSMRELVEDVARSDQPAAADELINSWVEPLAAALREMDARPREQRLRVARALQRMSANLRARLVRSRLDAEDQVRFDRVFAQQRGLIEELFHDDDRLRLAAIDRIPLEPDSLAGVLLVAKLDDDSAEVIDKALTMARELHDASVLRGARRFSRELLDEVQHAPTDLAEAEAAIVCGTFLDQCGALLAEYGNAQDAGLVAEILDRLADPRLQPFLMHVDKTLAGMGRIGTERAAASLVHYLEHQQVRVLPRRENDPMMIRTAGDTALLSLLSIYGLSPDSLGFVKSGPAPGEWGFRDAETRQRAHLAFRSWYQANRDRPKPERETFPALTAPAGNP